MGNGGPVQLPKPGDKGSGAGNGNGKPDLAKAFADLQTGKEEPLTIGGATFNDPRYASLFSDNGKKPAPQLMEQQVCEQNGAGGNGEGSYIFRAGQQPKPASAQPSAPTTAQKPAQQQAPAPSSQSQANGAQQNGKLSKYEIDGLRTQLTFADEKNPTAQISIAYVLLEEIKSGGGISKLHYLIELAKNTSDALAPAADGVIKLFSGLARTNKIDAFPGLISGAQQRQSPAAENALAKPPLATELHEQAVKAHHPTTPQAPKQQAPVPQQPPVHAQAAHQQPQPAQGSAPLPGGAGEEWRKDENFLKALRAAAEDGRKAALFGAQVIKQARKHDHAAFNRLKAIAETQAKTDDDGKLVKGALAIIAAAKEIHLSHKDPADVEKEAAEQIARGVNPVRQEFDVAKFVTEFAVLGNGERRLKMCEFNSEWEADPALISRLAALLAFTEKDGEVRYASSAEIVKSALGFIDAAGGTSEKRTAIGEAALQRIADLAGSMSVHPDVTKKSEDLLLKLATSEEMTTLLSTENRT